jgi:hypothetical protein
MSTLITLADAQSLGDLQTYLARAARVEDGSVRLIADSGVLAVYSAIVYPRGLLDESPTVLGLRTFALADGETFDAVVPSRSLLDRIARTIAEHAGEGPVSISRPHEVSTVTWAGVSPPRGGWRGIGEADAQVLREAARLGIADVAAAIPPGTGEQLVQRVRAEVWGRPIDGLDHVPAGAAFAAESLGFLADEPVRVFETGPWTRLTTTRGHVLIRRRPWTLRA